MNCCFYKPTTYILLQMLVRTRPSWVHFTAIFAIFASIGIVLWVPMLFLTTLVVDIPYRLVVSIGATLVLLTLFLPKAKVSLNHARWSVDLAGLESPLIGRIEFVDVVAVFDGFPGGKSALLTCADIALHGSLSEDFDRTLVLRLADGRILPLALTTSTIAGGTQAMDKLRELLAGKRLPHTQYTLAEQAALRSRPQNRMVKID